MGQHAYPDPLRFIGAFNAPAPNNTALNDLVVKGGIQKLGDIAAGQRSAAQSAATSADIQTSIDADIDASAIQALAAEEEANTDRTFQTRAAGTLAANAAGARAQQLYRERIIQKLKNTGLSEQAAIEAASRIAVEEQSGQNSLGTEAAKFGAFPTSLSSSYSPGQLDDIGSSLALQRLSASMVDLGKAGRGALSPVDDLGNEVSVSLENLVNLSTVSQTPSGLAEKIVEAEGLVLSKSEGQRIERAYDPRLGRDVGLQKITDSTEDSQKRSNKTTVSGGRAAATRSGFQALEQKALPLLQERASINAFETRGDADYSPQIDSMRIDWENGTYHYRVDGNAMMAKIPPNVMNLLRDVQDTNRAYRDQVEGNLGSGLSAIINNYASQ